MTQQEIIDGNKLIAMFLNWKPDFMGRWAKPAVGDGFNAPDGDYKSGDRREDHELVFHENWQWLMPVVEKIRELWWNNQIDVQLAEEDAYASRIKHTRIWAEIDTVYTACIQFIKWFNEQSK